MSMVGRPVTCEQAGDEVAYPRSTAANGGAEEQSGGNKAGPWARLWRRQGSPRKARTPRYQKPLPPALAPPTQKGVLRQHWVKP